MQQPLDNVATWLRHLTRLSPEQLEPKRLFFYQATLHLQANQMQQNLLKHFCAGREKIMHSVKWGKIR